MEARGAHSSFISGRAPETLAWATLVSSLGLPADPRWGGPILEAMRAEKRIRRLDGIGCAPAAIDGTRDELLARLGRASLRDCFRFRITMAQCSGPGARFGKSSQRPSNNQKQYGAKAPG